MFIAPKAQCVTVLSCANTTSLICSFSKVLKMSCFDGFLFCVQSRILDKKMQNKKLFVEISFWDPFFDAPAT